MPRPTFAAVAALLLVIPQAQAQVAAPPPDSGTAAPAGGPVASFGLPPLTLRRNPALAPGGRLALHLPPAVVAARWATAVRASLRGIVLNPWSVDTSAAARAAAAAAAAATEAPAARPGPQSPFGPYADLGMQLNLRFELKADQFRNLSCTPQETQLAVSGCHAGFPTISPDPQYSIRAAGIVGRRLHLNVDFDSQREFDANNNLQIWYEGLEDEVLRRVEAGNVTFQAPPSRFISAAIPANNFGLQAIGQVGPLELRGIYAQQKGNVIRDRFYTIGETTTQPLDREARDLDYAQGRFFFAVDPAAVPGYPAVDVLTIDPLTIPDALRVGSLRVYRVRVAAPGATTNQNIGGVRAVACAPTADGAGCALQRAGPFQWEVLQEGRDYYVDPSGAWFALATPLNEEDYLAVSYIPAGQPACDSPLPCIGTFPLVGNPDTAVVDTLRLVYDPKPGITAAAPSFRSEMRNAYRVGGQEISRETVALLLTVNQRERTLATGETYLATLGVAVPNDPNRFDEYNRLFPRRRDPLEGAPVRDYFIIFPHLTPFADSTRLTTAERNDSLYRTPRRLLATQGPPSVFTVGLQASVNASTDRAALSLNSFEIREGSEKLYLRNILLQRGRDYTIDYTTGQVQFTQPDSLFGSGVAQIRAQFEERAAFAIAPTSIYGIAGRYDLGERGTVNILGLFQKENSAFTRPPLGFEPSSSFIGGINADLRFQPEWLTRAADALPGVRTDAPSFLNVSGEVAVSRPSPNRFGQAYLEEFEAEAGRFVALAENAWRWGGIPSSSRGAEPLGVSPFGFDPFDAAALTWQNVPYNPNGQAVQFLPQQIDPTIRVTGQTQNAEPVLWLMLKPDTVLGLADSRTGEPNWVRPPWFGPRWRSLSQPLSASGVDLSRTEFLEFWVWEDNRRIAKTDRVTLLIDIGSVFEDALAWVPDSFSVGATGDTTYYGQRFVGQGRLDTERDPITRSWNATINDEGMLTDRVVDGIYDATQGVTVDTVPLCNAREHGQIIPFGFGDLRSRCGRHNGFVDTEDQDGDFALDSAAGVRRQEDFVRFVFPIGDDRYFVRDGGMIPVTDSLGNPDGSAGWRLYRIPFRGDTIQVGTPNLRQAQAIRVTIVAPQVGPAVAADRQVFFGLSRVRLVGAAWLKRAETPLSGLAGARAAFGGEVVASVVSTESIDLGYTPPPGVSDQASRQDAGLQLGSQQINEKSLRLLARGLSTGQRAEAYLRFTSEGDKNFLRYKTLRAWARGRGPGWEDGDLAFFLKAGKDENNFYYYQAPARTATWEPEVVVDLQRWLVLRARIEQAWLSGQPPLVATGCPDSTFLPPADSAYVLCDGPYLVHIHDPGTAPPNLAQVQEIAVGMVRLSERVFIDEAELWVDDIRLGDVQQDVGVAGALDVSLAAADVADLALSVSRRDGQFRQLGEDPSYVTDDAVNLGGTVRLERFLPERWGLAIPVSARVARTHSDPFYLNRTDVRADVLDGLRTPRSTAENYSFSIRRVRRASRGLGRWLDPAALSGSYTHGSTQSSYATASASSYALTFDYLATPNPAGVRVAGQQVRLTPTSLRFRSGLVSNDADRATYQVAVTRPADSAVTPVRSTVRTWRTNAGFDLLPLAGLQLRADAMWVRDLRDYGDSTSMGQVIRQERASFLGLDAGFETQRTITTFVGVTPRVAAWLRPRATLASNFFLNRDPNAPAPARTLGDSAGEFRVPAAFSNNRQADLGAQLDFRALGRGLWGDSAGVVRLLGRLQPVDLSFSRRLGSSFNRTGLAPPLDYQLALGGLGSFRSLDGVPATSANDNTTFTARGGAGLPLGFRFTTDYQRSRGESWLLRTGEQVPIRTRSRTWPSAGLSWGFNPRRLLRQVLTSVSAQAAYREVQTISEQPVASAGAGGTSGVSTASNVSHTVTPSLSVSWRGGILTSFDGSATRSEQVQAGTVYKADRDQYNVTLSFAFRPGFVTMRSPIRTSARYTRTGNTQCIRTAGQTECVRYADSRQRSAQLTMDTDFQSNIGAGLSVTYVLNDERQSSRKTSQLVIAAFVSFTTTVGQIR